MRIKEITLLVTLIISVCAIDAKDVGRCSKNDVQCSKYGAYWQHDGVCISEKCHVPDTRVFRFYLTAKMKWHDLVSVDPTKKLWVRGFGPTLSWDNPKPMLQTGRSLLTWTTGITYTSASNSLVCINTTHCSFNQEAIEFRISMDEAGLEDMLGPNFFIKLPISKSMVGAIGYLPPPVYVYPWFKAKSVVSEQKEMSYKSSISGASKSKNIKYTTLFPPSFKYNTYKTYPLIVMFGTHEVLHIAPLLEHLYIYEGSIKEAVIVSIHYFDEAPFCAFNPFSEHIQTRMENQIWKCRNGAENCDTCQTCWDPLRIEKCTNNTFITKTRQCLSSYSCTGQAGDLLDHIQVNLLPALQMRTGNRLQLDFPKQRMSVVGYSGGGLLACFAALSRPLYYQNAACLSAPFHWPMVNISQLYHRDNEGMAILMRGINNTLSIEPSRRLLYSSQKYYIDVAEDNRYFPVIDSQNYAKWMIKMLKDVLHLETDTNILYFDIPGVADSYYHDRLGGTAILNRIKHSLIYFLAAEGGPSKNHARKSTSLDSLFTEQKETLLTRYNSSDNGGQIHNKYCNNGTSQRGEQLGVPVSVFIVTVGE